MTKSALLVMDVQRVVFRVLPEASALLPLYSTTITTARNAGVPIIYVVSQFRPGHPDLASRNFSSPRVLKMGGLVEGDTAVEIHPDIAPKEGDVVVVKRRVSAFCGTDLEIVLTSLNVEGLVFTGFSTSGVVLSTVRQAADLDYRITVLGDVCYDSDPEIHGVLIKKLFPKQGTVTSADEWIAEISA